MSQSSASQSSKSMTLDVLEENTCRTRRHALQPDDGGRLKVALRAAPGATALQLILRDAEGHIVLAAEAPVQTREIISPVFRTSDKRWSLDLGSRMYVVLPPREPEGHLLLDAPGQVTDVAILIDGTMLRDIEKEGDRPPCSFLLQPVADGSGAPVPCESWRQAVSSLVQFCDQLEAGAGGSLWTQVLAFGDHEPPGIGAPDLRPSYLLKPNVEERVFKQFRPDELRTQLLSLDHSPGGDPLDALADALDEMTRLSWRQHARKCVVLLGQSPGYSILNPIPEGVGPEMANCVARNACIEESVEKLHRSGILIVTILHEIPKALGMMPPQARQWFAWARRQYQMLASLPSWSFVSPAWDPRSAAAHCLAVPTAVARGSAPGILLPETESA